PATGSLANVQAHIAVTQACGTDGSRVIVVNIIPNRGATISGVSGATASKSFMPKDAKHVNDVNVPALGVEHVYKSATLAASFPASSFTDSNANTLVAGGTFNYMCASALDGRCTIALGM